MPAATASFGFYPRELDGRVPGLTLRTLPGLADAIARVQGDPGRDGDWIHPGRQRVATFGGEFERPYDARIFGLPKTHELVLEDGTDAQADFVVWCLSFFAGMRFTTTDAGFLDATPVVPGRLVDFALSRCTLLDGAGAVLAFWRGASGDPRQPKRIAAAIHALFLAQYPQALDFERFQCLYAAIDACFKALRGSDGRGRAPSHAERIAWMCGVLGMPVPAWAEPVPASAGTLVSRQRNDAFHEALFFGEPLGFAVAGDDDLLLQMQALATRFVVAALGLRDCDYVRSAVDTRQVHALRLPPAS